VALEFNVTPADHFFLGEDKILELTIFGEDDITPLDVTGMALQWSLKKTDKAADPGIIEKASGAGITVVGVYNVAPLLNTQRVRIAFASADTTPSSTLSLKANFAYRHSLKRTDVGNENVLSYGSFTFMQATETA